MLRVLPTPPVPEASGGGLPSPPARRLLAFLFSGQLFTCASPSEELFNPGSEWASRAFLGVSSWWLPLALWDRQVSGRRPWARRGRSPVPRGLKPGPGQRLPTTVPGFLSGPSGSGSGMRISLSRGSRLNPGTLAFHTSK